MSTGECSIITEECVIDWNRVNDLLEKRGAPFRGWKGGILILDTPKNTKGGNSDSKCGRYWWENIGGKK